MGDPAEDRDVTPRRIQLSRARGYRKPDGAVVVSRPSKWGNPFKVGESYPRGPLHLGGAVTVRDRQHAVTLYRAWLFHQGRSEGLVVDLRGKDLACWCRLDQACHADVLLALANTLPKEATPCA